MAEHDYTAGDVVPGVDTDAEFNPETFTIKSGAKTTINPDQIGGDLAPGVYLVKPVGFNGFKNYTKDTFLNGKPVKYNSMGCMVQLADVNGGGTVSQFIQLPPEDPRDANAYYNGTNASGKAKGFLAQQFVKFTEALMPGRAWKVYPDGSRELTPYGAAIANWKNHRLWVTVEEGKQQTDPLTGDPKVNPQTGEPYPARNSVALFSFRPDVGTIPQPPAAAAKNGNGKAAGKANGKPAPKGEPEMATAGVDI